jgi:uncharacterized membrane protein YjgN (DUF898 family)
MTAFDHRVGFDSGPSPHEPLRFAFRGHGGEFFGEWLRNILLCVLTLGLYYPWARASILGYLIGNLEADGDRLSYHGSGSELFLGMMKILGIVVVAYVGLILLAPILPSPLFAALIVALYLGTFLLSGFAVLGAFRYRASRTSWRGVRFAVRRETKDFLREFALYALLVFVTLGFALPFFLNWRRGALTRRASFGTGSFGFDGDARSLIGPFLLTVLLSLPTLGLAWVWYDLVQKRHMWNHTTFESARFRLNIETSQWLQFAILNSLLVVLTLGLGWPLAATRYLAFLTDHLTLEGPLDLSAIRAAASDASATGESLADVFDVDVELG